MPPKQSPKPQAKRSKKARARNKKERERLKMSPSKGPVMLRSNKYGTAHYERGMKQPTALLRSTGRVRNELELCIALPGKGTACRLPTEGMTDTAIVGLSDQFVVNSPATPFGTFNAGDLLVALYGQIGRFLAVYSTNAASTVYSLYFLQNTPLVPGTSWSFPLAIVAVGVTALNEPWPFAGARFVSGTQVHGNILAAGQTANQAFIFMNTGDSLTISSLIGTITGNQYFNVYFYNGASEPNTPVASLVITLTAGSGSASYAATLTGYYSFSMVEVNATGGTSLTCVMTANLTVASGTCWHHYMITDVDATANGDTTLALSSRVNGASVLCTNTSAWNNRQGTVLAARLKGKEFYNMVPADLQVNYKYSGDAAKGVYTFKAFSEEAAHFENSVSGENSNLISFNLAYEDYVHFMQISCPGYASNPNSYTVTYSAVIEFQTANQRYHTKPSSHKMQDLADARAHINLVPYWFYENPSHMASLYNFIKRGAQKAYNHVSNNSDTYTAIARLLATLAL